MRWTPLLAALLLAACGVDVNDLPPAGEGGGEGTVTRGDVARDYEVDEAETRLVIRVPKVTDGCTLTHSHVVEAASPAIAFEVDVDEPSNTRITATVAASSLIADDPALRAEFPETAEVELSESDRESILSSALAAIRADEHPELVFVGGSPTTLDGAGSVDVDATFAGATSSTVLDYEATWDEDILTLVGSAPLDRTPHELEFTLFGGCVDDTMILELRLVLAPTPG